MHTACIFTIQILRKIILLNPSFAEPMKHASHIFLLAYRIILLNMLFKLWKNWSILDLQACCVMTLSWPWPSDHTTIHQQKATIFWAAQQSHWWSLIQTILMESLNKWSSRKQQKPVDNTSKLFTVDHMALDTSLVPPSASPWNPYNYCCGSGYIWVILCRWLTQVAYRSLPRWPTLSQGQST